MWAHSFVVLLVLVTSGCVSTAAEPPSDRDLYGEAMLAITGPTLFPAVRPPQLDHVLLQSVEGQELLVIQHRDITVIVCPAPPCGENVAALRTVEMGEERLAFTIEYQGLGQMPTPDPELNAELTEFWSTVAFVPERPAWLTMDLYPGSAASSDGRR